MHRRQFLAGTSALAAGATLPNLSTQAAPAPQDKTPFGLLSSPVLMNPSSDGVTVVVAVNALASARVEYGPTKDLGDRAQAISDGFLPLSDRVLSVRLVGLKPGQQYFYRVVVTPIDFAGAYKVKRGEEMRTDIYSFRTFDPAAKQATFTVWNDTHENKTTLAALIAALRASPTDFLLWNGDITNDIATEAQIVAQFLNPVGEGYATGVPMFLGRGNHDVRGVAARRLREYVCGPAGDFFYTFRHGPLAGLVLDTGEDKPDQSPVYAGLNDFDSYRTLERAWLEKAIEDPQFSSAPFRVAFLHIPLVWEQEVPANWPGVWGKGIKGWICEDGFAKWHDLLVKGRIDLVISGHTHMHTYFPPNEKRPYGQLIGGGPKPEAATTIVGTVSEARLDVIVMNLEGKPLISQSFERKGPAK